MLGTVVRLFTGGSDLLGAEARLLMVRLARIATAGALFLLFALVAAAAIITLGAGAAGVLAGEIGWPLALVTVGGSALIIVGVAALLVGMSLKRSFRPVERAEVKTSTAPPAPAEPEESPDGQIAGARRDILAAKKRLHRAMHGGGSTPGGSTMSDSIRDWAVKALDTAVRHPEAVLAGTFAVATVVGPTRVFRLISRAAGAVSMAATLTRLVKREVARASASPPARPTGAASSWTAP